MSASHPLLITADELAETLVAESERAADPLAPRTHILDVRWSLAQPNGHAVYTEGHIPGAVYVDLESELSGHGSPEDGRHPLPCATALTESARRWGLRPGDAVVAYDGAGNLASARLWWVLRDAGFTNVRLLDGALPAWVSAGLPLESGEVRAEAGTVTLVPGQSAQLSLGEVGGFAAEHVLLDARAYERYTGSVEPIDPQAGHIPGAVSVPTSDNIDELGRFLDPAVLASRFAAAGATPGASVGAYCGSGVTAAHELFALELAGVSGALFPGSWSQWSNHPDLPVATGEQP